MQPPQNDASRLTEFINASRKGRRCTVLLLLLLRAAVLLHRLLRAAQSRPVLTCRLLSVDPNLGEKCQHFLIGLLIFFFPPVPHQPRRRDQPTAVEKRSLNPLPSCCSGHGGSQGPPFPAHESVAFILYFMWRSLTSTSVKF